MDILQDLYDMIDSEEGFLALTAFPAIYGTLSGTLSRLEDDNHLIAEYETLILRWHCRRWIINYISLYAGFLNQAAYNKDDERVKRLNDCLKLLIKLDLRERRL